MLSNDVTVNSVVNEAGAPTTYKLTSSSYSSPVPLLAS